MNRKYRISWLLWPAVLGILMAGILVCPAIAKTVTPHVRVTGHGRLEAKADGAEIYYSVEGRGATAEEARAACTKQATALERALSAMGMVRRTSAYTGYETPTSGYTTVYGFVLVTERPNEVDQIGKILVEGGASCVSEACYFLTDASTWEREALTLAIADAKARAAVCGAGDDCVAICDRGSTTQYSCGTKGAVVLIETTVTLVFADKPVN
ncbi:MAG: DUF541 domain-containing protein [Ruminococcaceae bacterium]|nr:DUF541 domain-containing protein [Oscillospiraceae bacterium]